MGRMGGRSSGSTGKNTALFIGESPELIDLCEWARQRHIVPVEIPHQGLLCAVADEDVLDGLCTPGEASILQRAHAMGIPCLTPADARRFLASTLARNPISAT